MLARLLKGTRSRLRGAPHCSVKDTGAQDISNEVIALLAACEREGTTLALRDLHHRIDAPQPGILRAVEKLRAEGRLQVEQVLHDPLASKVTLTDRSDSPR